MAKGWTCPDCGRSFGRKNQSHECAPSSSVDDYFADRPAALRKIYDAIEKYVLRLGDVHVDPVIACIMFKRTRTFAEVRAKRDRLALFFLLSREVVDDKIRRRLRVSAHRTAHVVEIATVRDLDRDVKDWLAEAYVCSPA